MTTTQWFGAAIFLYIVGLTWSQGTPTFFEHAGAVIAWALAGMAGLIGLLRVLRHIE